MVYAAKWFHAEKGYEAAKIAWALLPGEEDSCDQNISSKIHRQYKHKHPGERMKGAEERYSKIQSMFHLKVPKAKEVIRL